MFENLSSKLEAVFKKLWGHGKLTQENIQEALKEVRMALLEADVHFKVVKDFIQGVEGRAVGQEVMDSLTPAQQLIKIVKDELTSLMGGQEQGIHLSGTPPVLADRVLVMREGTIRGELAGAEATEEAVMRLATHEVAHP